MLHSTKPLDGQPADPPYGSDAHVAQLRAVKRDIYGRCQPYTAEGLRLKAAIEAATDEATIDDLLQDVTVFNRLLDSGEVQWLRAGCLSRIGDIRLRRAAEQGDRGAQAMVRVMDRIREECAPKAS